MKNPQDFWAEWSKNKGKALVDQDEIKATELFQLAQDYAEYYHSEKLNSTELSMPDVVASCPKCQSSKLSFDVFFKSKKCLKCFTMF